MIGIVPPYESDILGNELYFNELSILLPVAIIFCRQLFSIQVSYYYYYYLLYNNTIVIYFQDVIKALFRVVLGRQLIFSLAVNLHEYFPEVLYKYRYITFSYI